MQEVKIYDFDFNLIASDFKCISFDWEVKFNSIGSFEGVFTADSPIYDACRQNEFTVCVQGENQGIVTAVYIKDDRIVITGKSMNYILEKRVCIPFSSSEYGMDMTETEIACKLVERYCGDFIEVKKAPALEKRRDFIRLEARPLSEVISEILHGVNCGHYVTFDVENKKWVFGCRLPNYTDYVLSKPDNTLEKCDYVRNIGPHAVCGVFKQKMKFMGPWNASLNEPMLFEYDSDNFGKVYLVSESGSNFGKEFTKGNYVFCTDLSGWLEQDIKYSDFWYKIYSKDAEGALKWECVLPCEDIEDAVEMLVLREIDENIVGITRGVNQKELKPGDVVEIRLASGENAVVFTRQVKKVLYHSEWDNSFVKPVFYKLKEN